MKHQRAILGIAAAILLASCNTSKENTLAYFQDLESIPDGTLIQSASKSQEIRIAPDDELLITVTSSSAEATAAYNLPLANPAKRSSITASMQPTQQTYIVSQTGSIDFPVLGKMRVQGMTTEELAENIKGQVSRTVRDPFVRVELVNFFVNVIGEVQKPSRIQVTKNKFNVFDALAEAGDLTEFARRDNVIVIRDEDGKKTYHKLNLTNSAVVSSAYFNLQQNDVIYVTPNKIKVDNSKYNQNNAYKLSVISTIVSAASVIASLVIALAVK